MSNPNHSKAVLKALESLKDLTRKELNTAACRKYLYLCDLADILFETCGGNALEIQTSPENKRWSIILGVGDLVLYNGREDIFFTLIHNADYLEFSQTDDDFLKIEFGVDNLWVSK